MSSSHFPGESIPDVFDRIAETARQIDAEGADAQQQTFSSAEPVTVEQVSDDGSMRVTVVDGRVTELAVDTQALQERDFRAIAPELAALVNAALEEYEQQNLALLTDVHANFGTLVQSLGHLQADLRAAFENDMRKLG